MQYLLSLSKLYTDVDLFLLVARRCEVLKCSTYSLCQQLYIDVDLFLLVARQCEVLKCSTSSLCQQMYKQCKVLKCSTSSPCQQLYKQCKVLKCSTSSLCQQLYRKFHFSADTCIPHVRTKTFGQRCFSYCAPKQWNSLPSDSHHIHIQSSHAFKTMLKTHLHKQYHK